MTTVVNNPATTTDSGNNMVMMVVIFLVVIIGILFFVYGRPALQSRSGGTNTVNSAPAPQVPQVVIPNKIDVNVQPAK